MKNPESPRARGLDLVWQYTRLHKGARRDGALAAMDIAMYTWIVFQTHT